MAKKRIALITGASSGLGREFALQLDKAGGYDELWLLARRRSLLEELANALDTKTQVWVGDICDSNFQAEVQVALKQEEVILAMLIQSAGMGKSGLVSETEGVNAKTVSLNCLALTEWTNLCLPFMEPGSRMIHVASVAAFTPQYAFASYAASKAYVLHFSRALHHELKDKGISVTSVCPNPMQTEFLVASGNKQKPEQMGLKKIAFEPVSGVAKKALRRASKGKELSLFGFWAYFMHFISKIVPHSWILFLERKIAGADK